MKSFIAIIIALAAFPAAWSRADDAPIVLGYFAEWERAYPVEKIPAANLTHINYAFAIIKEGKCALRNPDMAAERLPALAALKQKHSKLRTLISVGGWADSDHFSDVALTDASRRIFAESCVDFIEKYQLDGVDIDWEFPVSGGEKGNSQRPEDKTNFTLLLAELRSTLDRRARSGAPRYLLTIAAPAAGLSRIELAEIHDLLDFINLMTYDFAGSWSAKTGFNSALHPVASQPDQLSISGSVESFIKAGVPREKIVVGVPFYGRGWGGVPDEHRGLFQEFDKDAPKPSRDPDYWSYRGLSSEIGNFQRYWHDEAQVPWLFDAKRGLMITYDDPQSMKLKGRYAREQRLGGVMFWELSGDDDKSSLLNALRDGLGR